VRIATRIVWDSNLDIVSKNTRLYYGPVQLAKGGPTADQTSALESMKALQSTLTANYDTAFTNQSAILGSIHNALDPIVQAGINQFGFSKAEETALRTQASEGTAQTYAQAKKALSEQLAARGGGNTLLPSGAEESIQADLAGRAAESESGKQLGVTEAGYEQGRQNFLAATSGDLSTAQAYNPLGYASAATQASKGTFDIATSLYNQKRAASPWGTIGGLVGGAAGAFLGGPGGAALGGKFGSWLGGSSNNNGGTPPFVGGGGGGDPLAADDSQV
jgi:hypothetical protein